MQIIDQIPVFRSPAEQVGLALPFKFDPERLKADLALIDRSEWRPHYNEQDFGGEWRGTALRSQTGQVTDLTASFTAASTFFDTPLMSRCAYFRQAVSAFLCPLKAVRLLSLAPGSFIREHTDATLVYEDGEMRIHIPVQTSADVEFYVAGERLKLEEGHSYYVNVNLPHRITNRGSAERVHLIIDVEVNDWVHEMVRDARARRSAIRRTPPPPRNFDDFASVVLDEPLLCEELRAFADRSDFIEAVLRTARERGFELISPDVESALRVEVRNGARVRRVPRFETSHSKAGWTPIAVHFREHDCFLEWIYTGQRRFTEPFFEEAVAACLRNPFTLAFRQESRLNAMDDDELAAHAMVPSGFIFHMSRCGSTLVAQMLAALPQILLMSEPAPLNQVLQAHLTFPELRFEDQVNWVRRVVLALGQRSTGSETHYFIKLDPWNIHRAPLLRAAFPDAPFLFILRDPEQVMLSLAVNPSILSLPGGMPDPRVLGLNAADVTRFTREQWCAEVLTRIWESALAWRDDPKSLFVNYSDLPGAVYGSIARHFGLALDSRNVPAWADEEAPLYGATPSAP